MCLAGSVEGAGLGDEPSPLRYRAGALQISGKAGLHLSPLRLFSSAPVAGKNRPGTP
jgi:hypothetical protein